MANRKKSDGLLGKIGKILDVVPNAADIVGEAVGGTVREVAPLIEKSMDRRYEKKQGLVSLPNIVDIDVDEAKGILEELGFKVIVIQTKPNSRYAKSRNNEIVATIPKSGLVEPGSLVKLYYVTDEVVEESKIELEKSLKVEDFLGTTSTAKMAATAFMSHIKKDGR